jgi:phosphoribosyl-ATP pyrophosphohydrolase
VIIPSIDLQNGNAVQLIGGKEKEIDAGDPIPIAEKFRLAGEIAVIDLDAAMGVGSNEQTIMQLLKVARCRVGGGIRDAKTALKWLDAGAVKVIIGTSAVPEVLSQLPRDRVIAALDAEHDEIVVEGWQKKTGAKIVDRMVELRDLVGGFLVTFVEREGRMQGTDISRIQTLVQNAGNARITAAGGITTPNDIAALHKLGVDSQVGMAIYSGKMDLADAIAAPLVSDRTDGLWPTVVTDEHGIALGLAYSDRASLRKAVELQRGVYHSRKRGLWIKGETSGNPQKLLGIDLDCDADAIRFTVNQQGKGFCHKDTRTCWGQDRGLPHLARRLADRLANAPAGSYTARLFSDPDLLRSKLVEEAKELAEAKTADEVTWETADLIYFAIVAMVKKGVSLADVEAALDMRSRKVFRRLGNAKPNAEQDK